MIKVLVITEPGFEPTEFNFKNKEELLIAVDNNHLEPINGFTDDTEIHLITDNGKCTQLLSSSDLNDVEYYL